MDKEILQNNDIIAEFMGLPRLAGHDHTFTINAGKSNWYNTEPKYNESWDWLMPVFEKIEEVNESSPFLKLGCGIEIYHGKNLVSTYSESKKEKWIDVAYGAALNWIKYYNNLLLNNK